MGEKSCVSGVLGKFIHSTSHRLSALLSNTVALYNNLRSLFSVNDLFTHIWIENIDTMCTKTGFGELIQRAEKREKKRKNVKLFLEP